MWLYNPAIRRPQDIDFYFVLIKSIYHRHPVVISYPVSAVCVNATIQRSCYLCLCQFQMSMYLFNYFNINIISCKVFCKYSVVVPRPLRVTFVTFPLAQWLDAHVATKSLGSMSFLNVLSRHTPYQHNASIQIYYKIVVLYHALFTYNICFECRWFIQLSMCA